MNALPRASTPADELLELLLAWRDGTALCCVCGGRFERAPDGFWRCVEGCERPEQSPDEPDEIGELD